MTLTKAKLHSLSTFSRSVPIHLPSYSEAASHLHSRLSDPLFVVDFFASSSALCSPPAPSRRLVAVNVTHNRLQNTFHECLLNDHLCAHHRLDVPSKRWESLLSLFQLACDIDSLLRPRRDCVYGVGVDCSVALSGASVRGNPVDEKSVQVSVVHFAARDRSTVTLSEHS